MPTNFKMNPDHKEAWVQALRSGRYIQGVGDLVTRSDHQKSAHCCLGVLAAELGCLSRAKRCKLGDSTRQWRNRTGEAVLNNAAEGFLPHDLIPRDVQHALASMNDDHKSFDEIADYIKKNL
jgi:hypothetical protein